MLTINRLAYTVLSTTAFFFPLASPTLAQPSQYPAEVRQNFMNECVEKSGQQQICACVLDQVQSKYSLEQFSQLEAKFKSTGEISNDVKMSIYSCAAASN